MQTLLGQTFSDPRGPRNLELEHIDALKLLVEHTDSEDALNRLGIYSDAYFSRLKEILVDDFSLSQSLLGDAAFHELCVGYLKSCPSQSPNAALLGSRLPAFVKSSHERSPHPQLYQLCEFEWQIVESFFSPYIKTQLQASDLAALGDDLANLSFETDPSVRVLEAPYEWEDAWILNQQDKSFDISKVNENKKRFLLIRRQTINATGFYRMTRAEKDLYLQLASGKTLGAVCEESSDSDELSSALSELGNWVVEGLLKKVFITSTDSQ